MGDSFASVDYFTTSLPNMLLFRDDLVKRSRIEGMLLRALSSLGLGDSSRVATALRQLLVKDPNHQLAPASGA